MFDFFFFFSPFNGSNIVSAAKLHIQLWRDLHPVGVWAGGTGSFHIFACHLLVAPLFLSIPLLFSVYLVDLLNRKSLWNLCWLMTCQFPEKTNGICKTQMHRTQHKQLRYVSTVFDIPKRSDEMCKRGCRKVNNFYYALVMLMPHKRFKTERHSGRKRGITGARTELGLDRTVRESFFA